MSRNEVAHSTLTKHEDTRNVNNADEWLMCGEIAFSKNDYRMLFICKVCNTQLPTFGQFLQHSSQHHVLLEHDKLNEMFMDYVGNVEEEALNDEQEHIKEEQNEVKDEVKQMMDEILEIPNENFNEEQMLIEEGALLNDLDSDSDDDKNNYDNIETATNEDTDITIIVENDSKSDQQEQICLNQRLLKQTPHCVRCTNELLNGKIPAKNCKVCSLELYATRIRHEKKFECHKCGNKFTEKSNLNRHLERHAGLVRCLCPICGKTYITQAEMRRHIKVTHNKEKPYVCTECNKQFPSNYKLKHHMLRHMNERPFACQFCDKRFFERNALHCHLHTHQEERKFGCNICNLKFKFKRGLTEHLKTHSNVKSYKCPYCKEAFVQNAGLAGHKRRRHPELFINKN